MQYHKQIVSSSSKDEFSFTGNFKATRLSSPMNGMSSYDIGGACIQDDFMYITITVSKTEMVYRCNLSNNTWTQIHSQSVAGGSHQGKQSTFIWNNRYYSIAGFTHTKCFYIRLDSPSTGRAFLPDTPVYSFSGGNAILLGDRVFYGGFPTNYNVKSPIHYMDLTSPTKWGQDYTILNRTGVMSYPLIGHNNKGYVPGYSYRVTSSSQANYQNWTEFNSNRSTKILTPPSSNIRQPSKTHTAMCSMGDYIIMVTAGKVYAYNPSTKEEIFFGNLPFSPVYHTIVPHNGKVYMSVCKGYVANTGYSGFWRLDL